MKRIGILYHPLREKARDLSEKLQEFLSSKDVSSWRCSAWDEDKAKPQVAGTELILSIGGDGTILHCARIVAPLSVPILGINLGRLGFITEIDSDEVTSHLSGLLGGKGWIEERAMLEAQVADKSFHALNDVVLHSVAVRLVNIKAEVDGTAITTYRADGLIVATATGSTSYALASGGPILHPQSREIVLQPVSCHLGLSHALVLPPQSIVDLKVAPREKVVLSIDGQIELPLSDGQNVRVKLSPYTARFLRIHEPTYFYSSLWQKLGGRGSES
ncbi:MAG: NAD(+)/NADH kinase [Dehalococcoidia bacterium]|nr:NAD(+)/NADH kinase [Dehalococcoidia bacterium]MDH4299729.1 NAD(+)/NADH kinase [Dehalococcoidia bacterium]MDH4366882.1 NAD(+)/NADH kinase [Dehalococcoidia bacterium]